MKLHEKRERFSHSYWTGRHNKFEVTISRSGKGFYFLLARKADDKRHNSLWEQLSFKTIEEAAAGAEGWIKRNG